MSKNKYYVVWHGVCPGIYESWTDCKLQINGFEGALYKGFPTREAAEEAYNSSPWEYLKPTTSPAGQDRKAPLQDVPSNRQDTVLPLPLAVTAEAVAVDAACSGNPGPMEYQGIYLKTGQQIFHFGPVHGTNNIGEFLAIVHALALMKQKGIKMTIYSDSRNAIQWVKNKKCKTKLERTAKTEALYQLIQRAENWLQTNTIEVPIIKWETSQWGEIPADFGRK